MSRDRRREACGLENSATNPNHDFGLSALALPPNSEKRPHADCSDKQPIFTPKHMWQCFLDPQNSQGKRPGGSDLASGGGVTEIIDCNEESHLTIDGVV